MDENQSDSQEPSQVDPWHDDALDRKEFADFLTHALTEQARALSERQHRGLTVALDAEWGAGKTFFIERWADTMRRQGYPVVMFDAWKHDLGEGPSIVLMSAIHEALRAWFGRTTIQAETKERAREIGRKGIRHLRRAVLPTMGVILSGAFKKLTGTAVSDLKNAVVSAGDEDDDTESSDARADGASGEEQAKIDAGLDRIFEKVLGEQTQRIEAIANFRAEMGRAIDLIRSEAAAKMPVFVFVDELDRCRPSYAISLLEEIKHIFGMPQICFVVSTNLSQLSHSVRAVYGEGFDAEHYLKRFFDQTYAIPPTDSRRHIKLLLAEHPVLAERRHSPGLPVFRGRAVTAVDGIALIFDAFGLDLRSQKQVFRIAETAASAIPANHFIHTLWLFFLAVLIHRDQQAYARLIGKRNDSLGTFEHTVRDLLEDQNIDYWNHGMQSVQKVGLSRVIGRYYDWSMMSAKEVYDRFSKAETYPETNLQTIVEELPSSWNNHNPPTPSIHNYIDYVRYAGYIRTQADRHPSEG